MRKPNMVQTELLLKGASKLLMIVAFFNLYFILYQVPFGKPLAIFLMLTLVHWLMLALSLAGATIFDVAATHPEMRYSLTHLERKGQSSPPVTAVPTPTQAQAKVSREDLAEFERLKKLYPHLFADMVKQQQKQQQKQKLPLY